MAEMDKFSAGGATLNTEERVALRASLALLLDSQRFADVCLWGKVLTTRLAQTYFVAIARRDENNYFNRDIFFCQDLSTWVQSPTVSPEEVAKISELRPRFTGDPSFEYHLAPNPDGVTPVVTEAKRLTAIVHLINAEANVIPRGSFYKNGYNTIERNAAFAGLAPSDILELSSYMHFRQTSTTQEQLSRPKFEETIDIFDSIAQDRPKGIWSLTASTNGRVAAILKNNMWPGFIAYHETATSSNAGLSRFGCFYSGLGIRNHDLGFML